VTAEKVEVVISAYDGWLKGAEGVALTCKCKYKLTLSLAARAGKKLPIT
jgi:hypothetical protein